MIKLNNTFNNDSNSKTKILLQIHDELVFETPNSEVEKIIPIIKKNMTRVSHTDYYKFSIPLTVDIDFGINWGEAH